MSLKGMNECLQLLQAAGLQANYCNVQEGLIGGAGGGTCTPPNGKPFQYFERVFFITPCPTGLEIVIDPHQGTDETHMLTDWVEAAELVIRRYTEKGLIQCPAAK